MKNYYIVVTIEQDGKYFSYVVKHPENYNLLATLTIKNITGASLFPTKKKAVEIADFWNDCYKKNGTYLFAR